MRHSCLLFFYTAIFYFSSLFLSDPQSHYLNLLNQTYLPVSLSLMFPQNYLMLHLSLHFCAFFLRRSAINTHNHMPIIMIAAISTIQKCIRIIFNFRSIIFSTVFWLSASRRRCILAGSTLTQSPICFFLT